jgi:hypothetical protein
VPHALKIETLNPFMKKIAITDEPRLVQPLQKIVYDYVITELDAHSKTLGTTKIIKSKLGNTIRKLYKVQ